MTVPAVPRSSAIAPRVLFAIATVLVGAVTVAVVALDVLARDIDVPGDAFLDPGWLTAVTALAQLIPGLLLVRQLPRHPVAWVLVGSGLLWLLDALAASWAIYSLYVEPGTGGAAAAYWYYSRFGAVLLLGLPLLLLIFPDGRLPSGRWWRPLSVVSLTLTAILPTALILVPVADIVAFHAQPLPPEIAVLRMDPVSVSLPLWPAVLTVAYLVVPASLVVPAAVVVHRFRAAGGERRLQLRWLVWAGLVDAVLFLAAWLLPGQLAGIMFAGAAGVTSGAIVIAVTRYRLYRVDRLLSSTVVSALLLLLVAAVDGLLVVLAGELLGGRDSALLAIAVVAVLYTPLRNKLWAAARRLVRGSRDDPYTAVSALAERLESASGQDQQLSAVARSVAEAFRLPYVRVSITHTNGAGAFVEHGRPIGDVLTLPIVYRGDDIGEVQLCSDGPALSDRDQRLFGDLIRQAAAAARASDLSAELQLHRERLVNAREEERRRLRRDLHDSLGPSLGAVTLRIETARNLAVTDPAAADRLLSQAVGDVAGVLGDVRRLVHDLRPPALDEFGLTGALAQQAGRLSSADLTIKVDDAATVSDLPAAVEVAAYRIASEAMTNVVRHSGASRCEVRLLVDNESLTVEITDNGSGIEARQAAGVGMLSLRERAVELGGTCTVDCPAVGGTTVRAVLPLPVVPPRITASITAASPTTGSRTAGSPTHLPLIETP